MTVYVSTKTTKVFDNDADSVIFNSDTTYTDEGSNVKIFLSGSFGSDGRMEIEFETPLDAVEFATKLLSNAHEAMRRNIKDTR